jgi:hypothetical protein
LPHPRSMRRSLRAWAPTGDAAAKTRPYNGRVRPESHAAFEPRSGERQRGVGAWMARGMRQANQPKDIEKSGALFAWSSQRPGLPGSSYQRQPRRHRMCRSPTRKQVLS